MFVCQPYSNMSGFQQSFQVPPGGFHRLQIHPQTLQRTTCQGFLGVRLQTDPSGVLLPLWFCYFRVLVHNTGTSLSHCSNRDSSHLLPSLISRAGSQQSRESEETWGSSGEHVLFQVRTVKAGAWSHQIGMRSTEPNWTLKESSSSLPYIPYQLCGPNLKNVSKSTCFYLFP